MNIKEITLEEAEFPGPLLDECLAAVLHTILFVRAPKNVIPADHFCKKLEPLVYAKCNTEVLERPIRNNIEALNKGRDRVGPKLYRGVLSLSFYELRTVSKTTLGFFSSTRDEKVYFERWLIPVIINENFDELFASPSTPSSSSTPTQNGSGTVTVTATAVTSSPGSTGGTSLTAGSPPSVQGRAVSSERANSGEGGRSLLALDPAAAAQSRQFLVQKTRSQVHHIIRQIIENANLHVDHVPSNSYDFEMEVLGLRDHRDKRDASNGGVVSKLMSSKGVLDNLA